MVGFWESPKVEMRGIVRVPNGKSYRKYTRDLLEKGQSSINELNSLIKREIRKGIKPYKNIKVRDGRLTRRNE